MLYQSTRGNDKKIKSAEAIAYGMASDGGLFVPESFPCLSLEKIAQLAQEDYITRAAFIMSLFMDDFGFDELKEITSRAYTQNTGHTTAEKSGFTGKDAAPLHMLSNNTFFLELWHGPTCAFKDMALQVMPELLISSLKKIGETREVCILVATSGDTGKAALEGFCDVPGTKIMVFFPQNGVSDVQKLQMTSQSGKNVNVAAIKGNFDDAQNGVKEIFSDKALCSRLADRGYILSSANSINWGRLVPQVAYYFSAYCDLLKTGKIKPGEKINFCVPTGNFGNILAAYYAERMGLPVNKLICASNRNDVLTQFIKTGIYDRNRPFYTTVSPSMDILVSSNLERLLFELSVKNGTTVVSYMSALSEKGRYDISAPVRDELSRVFSSGFCLEEDTKKAIKDVFIINNYLIDTHTAVAYKVLNDYRAETGDKSVSVVVSTASPFKFCEAVLEALEVPVGSNRDIPSAGTVPGGGVYLIDKLAEVTGKEVPAPLFALKNAKERFNCTVSTDAMKAAVVDFIEGR